MSATAKDAPTVEPIRICICPNCGLRHGFAEPASSVPAAALTEEQIEYKVAAALQSGVVPPGLLRELRDLALAGLRAGKP